MRRALALAALGAALPAVGAAGQDLAGRWRLEAGSAALGRLQGELILRQGARGLEGTLLLATSDSAPVALDSVAATGDGELTFVVPGRPPLRFFGRRVGRGLRGEAAAGEARGPWGAERLPAGIEFYPSRPRLVVRQLIGGRGGETLRVPGRLLAAAAARRPALDSAYLAAAERAGLAPLSGARLEDGDGRALGDRRRAETLDAVRAALARVRAALPSDSLRRRFDQLFRARGHWVADLHDAALASARRRDAAVSWDAAMPALRAGGWLEPADSADAVPGALARLRLLQAADSAAFARGVVKLVGGGRPSVTAVQQLLNGYREAERWHPAALAFLLQAPWVRTPEGARSPAALVAARWAAVAPDAAAWAKAVPELVARDFGQPQATPRVALPDALAARVVRADNWTGAQWLAARGTRAALAALRHLPAPGRDELLLVRGGETLRVSSVAEQAAASYNGFLEPADQVAVEPRYVPLLAMGAVLHEWGHLLAERWRLERRTVEGADGTLELPASDPFVAEGWAERWTDLLLADLEGTTALPGFIEREKRARLARLGPAEPHVLGYLLVQAAAPEDAAAPAALRALLAADDLAALAALLPAHPIPARPSDDLVVPAPARRFLVPETTVTIEDGVADLVRRTVRTAP